MTRSIGFDGCLQLLPLLGCLLTLPSTTLGAKPNILSSTLHKSDSGVVLQGSGFGSECKTCEVIADYGSLKYRLDITAWSERRISALLPDLGLGDRVALTVITAAAQSNSHTLTLKARIVPRKVVRQLIRAHSVPELISHEFKAQDSLGDKGEISYDVSERQPACGQTGFRFHHARLLTGKRTRFGEAKIVNSPGSGCTKCQPLTVRYFYEPTGALHYQLHVYRRQIDGICRQKVLD